MYFCRGTIMLKYSTLILIFLQTCNAWMIESSYCPPSACGHIRNISYPFRLNTDPKDCGEDPAYELACEGNQTVISLFSKKLYVQAINYNNGTIHLVDLTLQTQDDLCSLRSHPNFNQYYIISKSEFSKSDIVRITKFQISAEPIFMFNCPIAVNNSSTFLEIRGCKFSRYTYIKIGKMHVGEVSDGCRAEFIGLTSWPNIKNAENNISLSDFHQALLYGFDIYYPNQQRFEERRTSVLEKIVGVIDWIRWSSIPLLQLVAKYYFGAKFVIGLPLVIVFLVIKFKRRHLSMYDTIEGFLRTQNNFKPIRYNYSHVKRMTRGYKEKLGEGGYGSVYKGKLQSGRDVAVKMLNKPKAGGQDFMNEVATIGRIHHVNVVGLVGYCVEGTKRALVYDFMPNGSLDKYISTSQEGSPLLSWQRKYDIILGVARGIGYLHRGCDVRILHFDINPHFDIKPHNILLDENFIPKISDFGLAKLYPTDNSIVNLTAARGTIGYVAPELISRSIGAISYKADVYSFGMLLMEMLDLNRHEVANEENSSQYFPYYIYDKFNKGKEILVDEEANDDEKKMARKLSLVALWCIQTNPIQRPLMSKVLEMLEGEVEVLEVPPQPIQSQPIVHQMMGSSMTFSSDSMALLENSVKVDICSD
ncbi:glycerophosphodiester phosphodiesterase protein kinase domain-containing GDPDL2-like [Solanum tuberosum]|uniref:glycerophosphodiester phosphodiesterase protein kinase domain-containing GDPDL2-like n=1 Tax=Solanum tuberosum TaxID=4113 RepID=UPI00073A082C|nr:PREDICTED: glycerophosphodiester phosphodiesterase protein kinase domain-containing GDPDL2-like [Solanum tuberosum]